MTNTKLWVKSAAQQAWEIAMERVRLAEQGLKLAKYSTDPVGFIEEQLGSTVVPDMVKVCESVNKNPITIVKSCNGPGKSFIAARTALWFYKSHPTAKVFMTAAPPENNIKTILWGETMSAIRTREDLFEDDKIKSDTVSSIRTVGNQKRTSFIQRLTIPTTGTPKDREAKFSGKHDDYMLFIVDEGDAVPEEVYDGIESCLSGGTKQRLLVLFNPRQKAGKLYRWEKEGMANVVHVSAFNQPNVITGKNLIPGAVDREITVKRINAWTRQLTQDEIDSNKYNEVVTFYTGKYKFLLGYQATSNRGHLYPPLDDTPRLILDPRFYYMVCGEYPAEGESQLVPEEAIANARTRWDLWVSKYGEMPPDGVQPIMGVDVADMGGDSNVCILRYGGFVPRIVHHWNGIDTDLTARKCLDIYLTTPNVQACYVDATGVGSSVAPSMFRLGREKFKHRRINSFPVKVTDKPTFKAKDDMGEFYQLRDQLYWSIREWLLTDQGSMLPPDPLLLDELRAYEYTVDNGKIRITKKDKIRELLNRSPDRADALAMTFTPVHRAKVVRLLND